MTLIASETGAFGPVEPELFRCRRCGGGLSSDPEGARCGLCGSTFAARDGVLIVKEDPAADNRIAADFYNGPLWPRFRLWERIFWLFQGGERRSREVILRHLPKSPELKLLDVAIGDGVYTSWLPPGWSVVGLDVSTTQLNNCQRRNTGRDLRLVLGEAEDLPFHDGRFDAVLSIGGFNQFNDPEAALREMVRVVKPGGTVVVSDEVPNLTDWMPGRWVGLPGLDRWVVSRLMRLGDDFTDLVERHSGIDIAAIGRSVLHNSTYEVIWRGGGYVLVGTAPVPSPAPSGSE